MGITYPPEMLPPPDEPGNAEVIVCERDGCPKNWQPIETAPKNEYVLVFCPEAADYTQIMICGLLEFEGDPDPPDWYELNCDQRPDPLDVQPTHWMPLPAPPIHSSAQECKP